MQELEKKFTQSDMNGGLIFIATFHTFLNCRVRFRREMMRHLRFNKSKLNYLGWIFNKEQNWGRECGYTKHCCQSTTKPSSHLI